MVEWRAGDIGRNPQTGELWECDGETWRKVGSSLSYSIHDVGLQIGQLERVYILTTNEMSELEERALETGYQEGYANGYREASHSDSM